MVWGVACGVNLGITGGTLEMRVLLSTFWLDPPVEELKVKAIFLYSSFAWT
jgi:hypothetical protein